MRRLFFGFAGAVLAAALAGSCKEDPTASLAGGVAGVKFEYAYREITISDSFRTFAVEFDPAGNPLPPSATVTSCSNAVAAIAPASDAPKVRTAFYIKAKTYGSTCVVVAAGRFADTMQVATFPRAIRVSGRDTVVSGASNQYTFAYFDAANADVTAQGVPAPGWRVDSTKRGVPTQAGVLSGFDPGIVRLTAAFPVGPGSDTLTDTKPVFVDPRPFSGTAAGTSGAPTDTVRFLRDAAATRFNQDTSLHATFDFTRTPTFVARKTLDSLYVIVPPLGATAPSDLVIVRVDNNKVAEKVTFTSTTTSLLDRYDRASDDPTTAPAITANGDYYITLSGICKKGVVTLPADDCDDFFKVTNATAASVTVSVQLDWSAGPDLDLYGLDDALKFCLVDGPPKVCPGATTSDPEKVSIAIPAGKTYFIYVNLFDAAGTPATVARLRVSGLP